MSQQLGDRGLVQELNIRYGRCQYLSNLAPGIARDDASPDDLSFGRGEGVEGRGDADRARRGLQVVAVADVLDDLLDCSEEHLARFEVHRVVERFLAELLPAHSTAQ